MKVGSHHDEIGEGVNRGARWQHDQRAGYCEAELR